ncbi:MAG: hypothetical protein HY811_00845 [Planctomycetes bacterium]|nr:hypothetical protein [Planctomycetota bacterium]
MRISNWKLIVGTFFFLCVFVINHLHADTWSQTTFPIGTGVFSDTSPADFDNDVKLIGTLVIDAGNGADGPWTISTSVNINVNTNGNGGRTAPDGINWQVNQNVVSGQAVISSGIAVPTGFAVGDEIIIINLKGASGNYANVGLYEFKRISVVAANSITVTSNLTNSYDGTTQKIMVQRIPNYTNVTIDTGGSLTCNAWNGTLGGVLAFRANGTVTVNVANGINANGKGFTGGTGTTYDANAGGGESYNGAAGSGGKGNPVSVGNSGQGGGGGAGDTNSDATQRAGGTGTIGSGGGGAGACWTNSNFSSFAGGGGGGGHGSAGGGGSSGSANGQTPTGSQGGSGLNNGGASGSTSGGAAQYGGGGGGGGYDGRADSSGLNTRAYMGGGGGAGGAVCNTNYGTSRNGASGGSGAGIIFISANTLNTASGASITANGANGSSASTATGSFPGAGGGGAGGSIILYAMTVNNSGNIIANGGTGGTVQYAGGNGGGGRTFAAYNSFNGAAPTPNYSSGTLLMGYSSSGTYISPLINPTGLVSWGVLTYTKNTPADTTFTVDVLKAEDNSVLVANVASGTNLASVILNYTLIKLRANLATSNPIATSTLSDWGIIYTGGGTTVTTTNWSDLLNGKSVQMGQSIAHVKFEMKTLSGTARWKRFRIDKGLKTYTNIACSDSKIETQVWCENNNNGFWDIGDTFISKGNFTNGTVYLNMNRWEVTTIPKTYYIVYKLKNDIGGGQRAGVKITDSSYLEFENAMCVGVPP